MSIGPQRIGPGHLVPVVGPSGAGKDTVLSLVQAQTQHNARIVIARRVITRPSGGAEDHDTLSDVEFDRAVADGRFAIWWGAHGNKYGIPVSIDTDIAGGHTVLCNVSRDVVASLRERYACVTVVLVTAPAEVLEQRLAGRGRSSDGDLAKRLARATAGESGFKADVTISNVQAPEIAAAKLLDIVRMHGTALAV